jgi:hypothetical protein
MPQSLLHLRHRQDTKFSVKEKADPSSESAFIKEFNVSLILSDRDSNTRSKNRVGGKAVLRMNIDKQQQ